MAALAGSMSKIHDRRIADRVASAGLAKPRFGQDLGPIDRVATIVSSRTAAAKILAVFDERSGIRGAGRQFEGGVFLNVTLRSTPRDANALRLSGCCQVRVSQAGCYCPAIHR
ncbi:hypothetical protein BAE40_13400 [Mesorhizobium loti]|nr:hypothetical protein BAE40_13400 [Mesorhizobium loti]